MWLCLSRPPVEGHARLDAGLAAREPPCTAEFGWARGGGQFVLPGARGTALQGAEAWQRRRGFGALLTQVTAHRAQSSFAGSCMILRASPGPCRPGVAGSCLWPWLTPACSRARLEAPAGCRGEDLGRATSHRAAKRGAEQLGSQPRRRIAEASRTHPRRRRGGNQEQAPGRAVAPMPRRCGASLRPHRLRSRSGGPGGRAPGPALQASPTTEFREGRGGDGVQLPSWPTPLALLRASHKLSQ